MEFIISVLTDVALEVGRVSILEWFEISTRVSHWANVFFFSALLHRLRSAAGHTVEQ